MTAQEYLEQVQKLDKRINNEIKESASVKESAFSISTPTIGEKVSHTFNTSAPYENAMNRYIDMERHINTEIDLLADLKDQVREAIYALENTDEQEVLSLRYLSYYTLKEIRYEMDCHRATVDRKMKSALEHFVVPADAIKI